MGPSTEAATIANVKLLKPNPYFLIFAGWFLCCCQRSDSDNAVMLNTKQEIWQMHYRIGSLLMDHTAMDVRFLWQLHRRQSYFAS